MPTIEKVSYEKIFPLAPYINEKIGVSYLLNETDDPKQVLHAAKDLCEEFHRESITSSLSHQFEQPQPPEPTVLPSIQVEKEERKSIEEEINSCETVTELDGWYFVCKNNDKLKSIYDIKKKILVAKESKEIIDRTNALTKK